MTSNTVIRTKQNTQVQLSTLWIFVMLNMLAADIYSFMYPGFLVGLMTGSGETVQVTPMFLLVAAFLIEIPIAMVFLSRILPYRVNRWANIIAAVVTIMFVIGGGSLTLHYLFFASVEVACLAFMAWYAWQWRQSEYETHPSILKNAPFGENA